MGGAIAYRSGATDGLHQGLGALRESKLAIYSERVGVLVNKSVDCIAHAPGKVLNDKRLARAQRRSLVASTGPWLKQALRLSKVLVVDALEVGLV